MPNYNGLAILSLLNGGVRGYEGAKAKQAQDAIDAAERAQKQKTQSLQDALLAAQTEDTKARTANYPITQNFKGTVEYWKRKQHIADNVSNGTYTPEQGAKEEADLIKSFMQSSNDAPSQSVPQDGPSLSDFLTNAQTQGSKWGVSLLPTGPVTSGPDTSAPIAPPQTPNTLSLADQLAAVAGPQALATSPVTPDDSNAGLGPMARAKINSITGKTADSATNADTRRAGASQLDLRNITTGLRSGKILPVDVPGLLAGHNKGFADNATIDDLTTLDPTVTAKLAQIKAQTTKTTTQTGLLQPTFDDKVRHEKVLEGQGATRVKTLQEQLAEMRRYHTGMMGIAQQNANTSSRNADTNQYRATNVSPDTQLRNAYGDITHFDTVKNKTLGTIGAINAMLIAGKETDGKTTLTPERRLALEQQRANYQSIKEAADRNIKEAQQRVRQLKGTSSSQGGSSSQIPYSGRGRAVPSRVGQYELLIQAAAKRHGVNPAYIRGIIAQESGGQADVTSPAGAMGLMQIMPGKQGVTNPYDPAQNIEAGTREFADNLRRYNGNLDLALAAYNAGPGAVSKYGGVPPYRETRNYIPSVKAYIAGQTGQTFANTAPSTTQTHHSHAQTRHQTTGQFTKTLTPQKISSMSTGELLGHLAKKYAHK